MSRVDKRIAEYIDVCGDRQAAYLSDFVAKWDDKLSVRKLDAARFKIANGK